MRLRIARAQLEAGARQAEGVVVVVDVIRAFTTAAFALDRGAREVRLFAEPGEVVAARARFPGAFAMGEVGGAPPPGFDHGNSPSLLPARGLEGRVVLQRTGLGTRCAVAAEQATALYASSLVVSAATAGAILAQSVALVTIVESGGAPEGDDAVADRIEGLLRGTPPPLAETLARVRACPAARELLERRRGHSPPADLECCLDVDRFDFAIKVERDDQGLVARRQKLSDIHHPVTFVES